MGASLYSFCRNTFYSIFLSNVKLVSRVLLKYSFERLKPMLHWNKIKYFKILIVATRTYDGKDSNKQLPYTFQYMLS
jgi:hypothetical protein